MFYGEVICWSRLKVFGRGDNIYLKRRSVVTQNISTWWLDWRLYEIGVGSDFIQTSPITWTKRETLDKNILKKSRKCFENMKFRFVCIWLKTFLFFRKSIAKKTTFLMIQD